MAGLDGAGGGGGKEELRNFERRNPPGVQGFRHRGSSMRGLQAVSQWPLCVVHPKAEADLRGNLLENKNEQAGAPWNGSMEECRPSASGEETVFGRRSGEASWKRLKIR